MNTTGVDLLNLAGRYTTLKKVASTGGGEWHGPCPRCAGVDRFQVQPNYDYPRWACRQCSPQWQDAIAFVQWVEGVDFRVAIERLGLQGQSNWQPNAQPRKPEIRQAINLTERYPALMDRGWQERAGEFEMDCRARLFSADGVKALQYLKDRGLTERIVRAAGLGYNDSEKHTEWGAYEVWLPRSITIPWMYRGQYWRVNMRQPVGSPKYISPKGSANGLYDAHLVKPGCTVVMVEGELDALALRSQAPAMISAGYVPVATGTASWGRALRWVATLSMAKRVLLAFDTDEAGNGAAEWWQQKLGMKAIRLEPTAHDVTDMVKAGHDLVDWLLSGVGRHLERSA